MTLYPSNLDSDSEIQRIDDNVTEIAGQVSNSLRDAVFAIEKTLGINPQSASGSVADRLSVSLNPDGTIKASALTSVGLATLPIVDNQVANNAGIKEIKLTLDYSTSNLHTLMLSNTSTINAVSAFLTVTNSNLLSHISGAKFLQDGITLARHVASQIDLNATPFDTRDSLFTWPGLLDKNGIPRAATTVAQALLQINNDLTSHENATSSAHQASAITVDTDNFIEISKNATNVQSALEEVDNIQTTLFKTHRENLHANGISRTARSQSFKNPDGYSQSVVSATPVNFFLIHSPATMPVDSTINGDNLIVFNPDNSGFLFDAQFNQVRVGDIVRINYNSIETSYPVESIRFTPGSEWAIRITANNLTDGHGYARIDRSLFEINTSGILAVAPANQYLNNNLSSLIMADPKSASILGLGFNATKLDDLHYNLYLQLYPTGDPSEHVISLLPVDVTGNKGVTPGKYTFDSVLQSINDTFRSPGFNFRFIAYGYNGEIGIALADTVGGAGFSIVSGTVSSGTLGVGAYANNVVGDALDNIDPLGFGFNGANVASPAYSSSFSGSASALLATKLFLPLKNRKYNVNGIEKDNFQKTYLSIGDGYWPATISSRVVVGISTIEVSYEIPLNLCKANLAPGKTIVVQPVIPFSDSKYNDVDYGRFIIKQVSFDPCGTLGAETTITIINGLHGSGTPVGFSSAVGLNVYIYFSEDSVSFDGNNIADSNVNTNLYNRFHEIYIEEHGNTFSHERARMPLQSGSSTLLDTTDAAFQKQWNIINVSPKLRGFKDDASVSLNRYVRFYVLNYNSVSGEYDGYLGKRDPFNENISRFGQIVTARKNVPTKFYDETNIDFIELEFVDVSSIGTTVASGPRYVDIQVFPSLELDDELLLLSTCELRASKVYKVRDARQFGTLSEKNFTTSAIDFIRANDRELRDNGIIRGFDFVSFDLDANANPKIINYTGGAALVGGAIVLVNNSSVEIPQIYPVGSSLPQTLTWAVCANKYGQLQAILITPTRSQSFLQKSGSDPGFYEDSVTFAELVNTRRDLAVIDVVTATINSILLSRSDARRFINLDGLNHQLVWSGSSDHGGILDIKGNFRSFDSLKTWINNYGSVTNRIVVRGQFFIEPQNPNIVPDGYSIHLDLTNFNYPVIFDAENATVNIFSTIGFRVGSNITLRNFKFVFKPAIVSEPGIVVSSGGCIYGQTSLSNVVIDSCIFTSPTLSSGRQSFISFRLDNGDVIDGLTIKNCQFNDDNSGRFYSAIAIVSSSTGGLSDPAVASNVLIENNICNADQGIYITVPADSDTLSVTLPGIVANNVTIRNNNCGMIGHIVSSKPINATFRGSNKSSGLSIVGNTCRFIAPLDSRGRYIAVNTESIPYGSGNINISDNFCNTIVTYCRNNPASPISDRNSVIIKNNILNANDPAFGTIFGPNMPNMLVKGIFVDGITNDSKSLCSAIIDGNSVDMGLYNGVVYKYFEGIEASCTSNVVNNFIAGIDASSYGIVFKNNSANMINILCSNNIISRFDSHINSYVFVGVNISGQVVDNIFDSPTVDGVNYADVISSSSINSVITERNKNQTKTKSIVSCDSGGPGVGTLVLDQKIAGNLFVQTSEINIDSIDLSLGDIFNINFNTATSFHTVDYSVDLQSFLPENTKIIRLESSIKSSQALSDGGANLTIKTLTNLESATADLVSYTANTSLPMILDVASVDNYITSITSPILLMHFNITNTSNPAGVIRISKITVFYRW